jgi:hypothetical protein
VPAGGAGLSGESYAALRRRARRSDAAVRLCGLDAFDGTWIHLHDKAVFLCLALMQSSNKGVDPNPNTTNDITIQLRLKGCAGTN